MRAGRMRDRLTILTATVTDDGRGGRSKVWGTLGTVSGQLVPLRGDELDRARRLVAGVTHQYAVRYSPLTATLTPQDTRLVCAGKTYEVATVLDVDHRQRELRGEALEVAA